MAVMNTAAAPMGGPPGVPIPPAAQQVPNILPVRFWTEYKTPVGISPDARENAMKEGEDWVMWVNKGQQNPSTTSEAIKRLQPNAAKGRPRGAPEWAVIGPAYEAWKRGEDIPLQGTPLYLWAGIDRNLVEELKKFNIRSIEDLAELPDHRVGSIPLPNVREYIRRAKAYKEAQETASTEAAISTRDAVIEDQARQLKEMQDLQKAQAEQIAALVAGREAVADALVTGPGSNIDDEYVEVGPNDVPVREKTVSRKGR